MNRMRMRSLLSSATSSNIALRLNITPTSASTSPQFYHHAHADAHSNPRPSLFTSTSSTLRHYTTSTILAYSNSNSNSSYRLANHPHSIHYQGIKTFHGSTLRSASKPSSSSSSSSTPIPPQQDQQPLPSDTNYSYASTPESASQQPQAQVTPTSSYTYDYQYQDDGEGGGYHIPRHLISTSHEIPPHHIAGVVGLVQGNTVRVRNAARDYVASIRALFGGELRTYTDLMKEAREEAIKRMTEDAVKAGANGIVSVRITTSAIASNASELTAYGTAVILENGYGGLDKQFNDDDDDDSYDYDYSLDKTLRKEQRSESSNISRRGTSGGNAKLKIDQAAETAQHGHPYDLYRPKT